MSPLLLGCDAFAARSIIEFRRIVKRQKTRTGTSLRPQVAQLLNSWGSRAVCCRDTLATPTLNTTWFLKRTTKLEARSAAPSTCSIIRLI